VLVEAAMFGLVVRLFLILRRLLNRNARREVEILVLRMSLPKIQTRTYW
jgi:hypothetical protein